MQNTRRRLILAATAGGILTVTGLALYRFSQTGRTVSSDTNPGSTAASNSKVVAVRENSHTEKGTGAIKGTVLFRGRQLNLPPNGRTLTDVVIYLKGSGLSDISSGTAVEQTTDPEVSEAPDTDGPKTAVLDQFDMTFVPHVVTMQKGGTLEIRNSDTALHNVNGLATANQAFNVALSPDTKTDLVLPRAEFIRVICNFHSRMNAWVAVLPNRFFTRVNDDGQFTLTDIPAGTYTLAGWHEDIYPPYTPHQTNMQVSVEPGHTTIVELNFP